MQRLRIYTLTFLLPVLALMPAIFPVRAIDLSALFNMNQNQGPMQVGVPYVSQIPDGRWVNPWANACEEASTMMIAYYYSGIFDPTKAENKMNMQALFRWEDGVYGFNYDTNAEETAQFINATAPFTARVVRNPSVEDIKQQLWSGRPVMAMVNQYTLYNTRAKKGTSYHVLNIVGYDDRKKTFLIYDPATPTKSKGTEYAYDRVMKALHDYNRVEDEANGDPVVLFTDVR